MKNSTSLRRRNQFLLFLYTLGMFLFTFLCMIRGLDYPLAAPIIFVIIGGIFSIIFATKKLSEPLNAALIILLLNITGVVTLINTDNPFYVLFLIFDLLLISLYFSFILNVVMLIVTFLETGLLTYWLFPELWRALSSEQLFWLLISILFLITFSLVQALYLHASNRSIERKNVSMEKEFESKEGYLKLFFENAKDSIAVFDLDNKVIAANPAFVKLYGWSLEESIGQQIPMVPPDYYEASKKRITNMVAGESFDLLQTKDMKKDGTIFDAEVTLSPIFDANGQVIATSVITRDVSYRKEAEELRVQSEKLKMAGEIAAGVAHEVKNPLSVISGFVQMMNEDVNSPYTYYTKLIKSEIDRINLIISEFLVLSKPHAQDAKDFNIEHILQDMLALFKLEMDVKNITIHEVWDAPNAIIKGDANQIKQVFINIFKNAIEAIEAEGHIDFAMTTTTTHVVVKISDNGIGMKKDVVDNIFQPFYTTKEKGTGLGMMITEKIIHEYKGDIKIKSTYGVGTEFTILLPLSTIFYNN